MDKTLRNITPGGNPATLENPSSNEADPMDSGGDRLLLSTSTRNIEGVSGRGGNPFCKTNKTIRTPPQAARSQVQQQQNQLLRQTGTKSTPDTPTTEAETANIVSSPTQEFILRMRAEEENALEGCKKALRKMKQATNKQRNVSMDIKDAISEIEDYLSVIATSRANWKRHEREKQAPMNRRAAALTTSNDNSAATNGNSATPTASTTKRIASSPAEKEYSTKKPRGQEVEKWQTVGNKKPTRKQKEVNDSETPKLQPTNAQKTPTASKRKRKSKARSAKSEALLIKPTEGHSYAEVLKNLRNNAKSDEDLKVRGIRKTKTGALLIELGRGEKVKPELCELLKAAVKDSAKVSTVKPAVTIVIRNLDAMTTAEEVVAQIRKTVPDEELKVHVTAPDSREQVRAYVTLAEDKAQVLLEAEFIKIGFIRARMTRTESVKRCYRCFGIGHFQYECKGPDRKKDGLCIRCGETGHKLKECKNTPKCWVCTDSGHKSANHQTGARKCQALKKLSAKRR